MTTTVAIPERSTLLVALIVVPMVIVVIALILLMWGERTTPRFVRHSE